MHQPLLRRASIARLGVGSLDVYSLHAPLPYLGGRRALYEGFAECYDRGLCRGVGVNNFHGAQLREAYTALRALGVPLVSNGIKCVLVPPPGFSPLSYTHTQCNRAC